ncbi:SDR family NAD(P)-dependent oxidoreductase [Ningiella sp. W23]|uniref:SDR family NAD(P)-dependent oxidoreductase n=1 Tax=Ningiella sp. W23 TaxID=3023715 RepID=UPI0037580BE5
MQTNVLIIGASGGIATALTEQLLNDESIAHLVTVSRSAVPSQAAKHRHVIINSQNEDEIKAFVQEQKGQYKFHRVICCTGILHAQAEPVLKPEKRLEDMRPEQFIEYFKVNTVVPALWIKHAIHLVDKAHSSIVVFSARVGSISENALGGWYGYRSSKAALNMIVKTAAVEYARRSANTVLICYHPGTVDTDLSKPFQANVKPEKLFTPAFTASQLLKHTANLSPEASPYYLDWDGKTINW